MSDKKVSLVKELCRVLDSDRMAMLCAMSHGQVTVSGHVVKPEHDRRWTRQQLAGRTAKVNAREAKIFGSTRASQEPSGETTVEA